jgi:hypothetical protein
MQLCYAAQAPVLVELAENTLKVGEFIKGNVDCDMIVAG